VIVPIALAILVAALMLTLAACGVPTGQPLSAIHTNADSWDSSATSDGSCLECHDHTSIVRSTEDYDGLVGVSIHEPPPADHSTASCVSCHRTEKAPVLTCNQTACHAYTLPEGWTTQD
jgi:hypothetical protein